MKTITLTDEEFELIYDHLLAMYGAVRWTLVEQDIAKGIRNAKYLDQLKSLYKKIVVDTKKQKARLIALELADEELKILYEHLLGLYDTLIWEASSGSLKNDTYIQRVKNLYRKVLKIMEDARQEE